MAIPTYINNIRIFTKFGVSENETDIVSLQQSSFAGLFTNGVGTLISGSSTYGFYTSNGQTTTQKKYFLNVHQESTSSSTSKVQFSLAFGHKFGSGSAYDNSEKSTKVIYSQMANLLLDSSDGTFTFRSGSSTENVDSNHILVMAFKRNLFKDKIDVDNWQLTLKSGSAANTSLTLHLVDNSSTDNSANYTSNGRKYYYIVSGTLGTSGTTIYNSSSPHYYGHIYPELGLLLFNGSEISRSGLFNTYDIGTSTTDNYINVDFFDTFRTASFRNEELINSSYYYIRVRNKDYNFTNNPTYVSGSNGKLIYAVQKRGIPFTYITTIGLYDNFDNLLAVAKLSKPIFKEPGSEALIKVRIDF